MDILQAKKVRQFVEQIKDESDKKRFKTIYNEFIKFNNINTYNKFILNNIKCNKLSNNFGNIELNKKYKEIIKNLSFGLADTLENIELNQNYTSNEIGTIINNYDIYGGITQNKVNPSELILKWTNEDYEYKIGDKIYNVKNEFIDENTIKYYIKTKSGYTHPFIQLSINQVIANIDGPVTLFLFTKSDNGWQYKGKYYCIDVKDESKDGNDINYFILKSAKNQTYNNMVINSLHLYEKILFTKISDKTEVERIMKQRIGQSFFREMLIKKYHKCLISNIENKKLLVASHIKPWSKSSNLEKLDINNGLLLNSLFDKLFDTGLISFDENGNIMISSYLSIEDKKIIFSEYKVSICINLSAKSQKYMEYHNKYIFIS